VAPRSEPFRPDAPIVPEIASGAVILHAGSQRILLLHEIKEDRWCFPKGHVEAGESLLDAARREIHEETGLSQVLLDPELGEVSYRFFQPKKARNVHKTTVYFLGRTDEQEVALEPIFDRSEWVTVEEARGRLPYESDRRVLAWAAAKIEPRE
jgi:8-oxo-dGTP pyrophosphatase MutT (NUDIX family)